MGTLFVVATPIGNLEDFTFRALKTLQGVDLILCEDTRVARKLLVHYNIEKPLLSYHQHSKIDKMQEILSMLIQGRNLALVTDAGTPGVSDPGNELVAFLLEKKLGMRVIPIPGPSALTTIASVVGIPMDKFLFLGYPPHKKGRKKFFAEVAQSTHPTIFYESPYRVLKSLSELRSILDTQYQRQDTQVVVGRELTKKFEAVYRGTIAEVMQQLHTSQQKGEFVVIVDRAH